MGVAYQGGNTVTLSYRQPEFVRIKERNAKRIEEHMRSGKIKVLFNSNPVEFKGDSVVLAVKGKLREIPNDFVCIFATSLPPTHFLPTLRTPSATQPPPPQPTTDPHHP